MGSHGHVRWARGPAFCVSPLPISSTLSSFLSVSETRSKWREALGPVTRGGAVRKGNKNTENLMVRGQRSMVQTHGRRTRAVQSPEL